MKTHSIESAQLVKLTAPFQELPQEHGVQKNARLSKGAQLTCQWEHRMSPPNALKTPQRILLLGFAPWFAQLILIALALALASRLLQPAWFARMTNQRNEIAFKIPPFLAAQPQTRTKTANHSLRGSNQQAEETATFFMATGSWEAHSVIGTGSSAQQVAMCKVCSYQEMACKARSSHPCSLGASIFSSSMWLTTLA